MTYDVVMVDRNKKQPLTKLHHLAIICGGIFSALLILTIGVKIVLGFFNNYEGTVQVKLQTFRTWDDPVPFFIIYMLGYVFVWIKPMWGSVIIMGASIYYVIIQGFDGPPILATPGFIVGLLYFLYWFKEIKK